MRFSVARVRRRFGIIAPIVAGVASVTTILIWLHDLFKSAQWLEKELKGMNQYLAFIVEVLLSPALYAGLSLSVALYLVIKVATKPISSRAESFIETAERWIASAQELLDAPTINIPILRTWQERAALDLSQFLGWGKNLDTFKREGNVLPTEFELGEVGLRSAVKRQIRCLKELIVKADSDELDLEVSPSPRLVV